MTRATARNEWAEQRAAAVVEGAPKAEPLRALLYTRVSVDKSGRARSPHEQEAAERIDVEQEGWTVAEVYTDNDISASRYGRKIRHDFARLRSDIKARRGDVVVTWAASRLARDMAVYTELVKLCREHGVLWRYNGRTYDLNDVSDEYAVGMDGLNAQRESGERSRDIRRAMSANATNGMPHGRAPFGYVRTYDAGRATGMMPDPKLGPLVHELFTRAARGESLYAIARDWQAAGVTTKYGGGRITVGNLTKMLPNRAYLGERWHLGVLAKAKAWPALTDETTFRAANARARRPYARNGADTRAKHLASGILACGVCGTSTTYQTGKYPAYSCQSPTCSCSRAVHRVDEILDALVVKRLLDPKLASVFTPPENDLALMRLGIEREAIVGELADAKKRLGHGLSVAGYADVDAALRPQLADIEARIESMQTALAPPELLDMMGAGAEAKWAAARANHVSVCRVVLRTLFADLAIEPVGKGRRADDAPVGLRYRWFGDPADELNTWRV